MGIYKNQPSWVHSPRRNFQDNYCDLPKSGSQVSELIIFYWILDIKIKGLKFWYHKSEIVTLQLILIKESCFLIKKEEQCSRNSLEVGRLYFETPVLYDEVIKCLDLSGPQFPHLQNEANALFRVNVLGTKDGTENWVNLPPNKS